MKRIAEEKSAIFKDQFHDPADETTYWIEYIIRHNGANHLKSPIVNMSW